AGAGRYVPRRRRAHGGTRAPRSGPAWLQVAGGMACRNRAQDGRRMSGETLMQHRRQFLKAGAALTLAPMLAKAQSSTWPQRPVRIVIPSAAGSPWDPLIRLTAERLSKDFGQSFVVEN